MDGVSCESVFFYVGWINIYRSFVSLWKKSVSTQSCSNILAHAIVHIYSTDAIIRVKSAADGI